MKTFRKRRRASDKHTRRMLVGASRDWYRIPEIPFNSYVKCLRPLYSILGKKNASKTSPDIFLQTILASHSGMTVDQWNQAEAQRLYEKTLSMKMGDFHEELMGKFPGYETLPVGHATGTDVKKSDDTEFFEVKNRDNTMNSGSGDSVIRKLAKLADEGKRATLVMVNTTKKKVPRFKAPAAVHVVNGKDAYAYLSGRDSFFDDLVKTLDETFKRFPSYESLENEATVVQPPPPI